MKKKISLVLLLALVIALLAPCSVGALSKATLTSTFYSKDAYVTQQLEVPFVYMKSPNDVAGFLESYYVVLDQVSAWSAEQKNTALGAIVSVNPTEMYLYYSMYSGSISACLLYEDVTAQGKCYSALFINNNDSVSSFSYLSGAYLNKLLGRTCDEKASGTEFNSPEISYDERIYTLLDKHYPYEYIIPHPSSLGDWFEPQVFDLALIENSSWLSDANKTWLLDTIAAVSASDDSEPDTPDNPDTPSGPVVIEPRPFLTTPLEELEVTEGLLLVLVGLLLVAVIVRAFSR